MTRTFMAYIERDPESGLFTGCVPPLSGAHSQGETLGELLENLREVVTLCLEEAAARGESVEDDRFVGVYKITAPG